MKRVVIGTAGHVDHGKTSLIKAITGIDCDRLKEEKERGLTIELGFASMALPSGERVGVIDVPGHVRFIRHMLSGASGIDLALLVIAADEGVMPQTREHVQICELLGIERGVVALTKKDLVDEDLLELAASDVKDFIAGTFLKDAPVVAVSSTTREGLDELLAVLDAQVALVRERQVTGIPVLPVDRVFSIKGFGTVVTGTLARGSFTHDMEVEVLPAGRTAKIRTIQVHDTDVETAQAGMRTAVNLQGLATDDIDRGDWVAPAGVFETTRLLDARLTLLRKPGRGGIRLYLGTAEVLGGISLYTVDSRAAGRIRLKEPVLASYGDRFILRSVSPSVTLGGGVVLNPHPARRFSEEVMRDLMHDDPAMRIVGLAKDAGMHGIARRRIEAVFADAGQKTEKLIAGLLSSGELVRFDAANDLMVHGMYLERLKGILLSGVKQYHEKNPSSPGMSREHLRSSVQGGVDPKLFHRVLQDLIRKGDLSESGPTIAANGFSASMASDHTDALEAIAKAVEAAAFAPPRVAELAEQLRLPQRKVVEILAFLCREGRLVRINDELYLSGAHEQALRERVREFIEQNQALAPADMKTIVGATRKFAIPFLEYLDRIHFTIRVGDARKLAAARGPS